MGLSDLYWNMYGEEKIAQELDLDAVKVAMVYERIGQEMFKAASTAMANASTEYGAGGKLAGAKNSFTGMVQKIMGKLGKGSQLKRTGGLRGSMKMRRRGK